MYKLFLFLLLLQPCLGYNYFYNTNMTMSIVPYIETDLMRRQGISGYKAFMGWSISITDETDASVYYFSRPYMYRHSFCGTGHSHYISDKRVQIMKLNMTDNRKISNRGIIYRTSTDCGVSAPSDSRIVNGTTNLCYTYYDGTNSRAYWNIRSIKLGPGEKARLRRGCGSTSTIYLTMDNSANNHWTCFPMVGQSYKSGYLQFLTNSKDISNIEIIGPTSTYDSGLNKNNIGGKGNDFVFGAGLDRQKNKLFYFTQTLCSTYSYGKSELVRLNLNDMSFHSRKILNDESNAPNINNNKNYLKTPTFMVVDPGKYIYVGFYHADTAIFRFDLSSSNLNWNEYVREQYSEIETYQTTNIETGEEETQTRTTYHPLGFFSFGVIDIQRRFLFAISLEKYSSKIRIMKIGLDNDFIANNSKTIIKEFEGISYITKVEYDTYRGIIYILTGDRSPTQLFRIDYNLNLIKIEGNCEMVDTAGTSTSSTVPEKSSYNTLESQQVAREVSGSKDSLTIPSEFGRVYSMSLDERTGFIYAFSHQQYLKYHILIIDSRSMVFEKTYDLVNMSLSFIEADRYNARWYPIKPYPSRYYDRKWHVFYANVSTLTNTGGQLLLGSTPRSSAPRPGYILKGNLLGCTKGRGPNHDRTYCIDCNVGYYSNSIGTDCLPCPVGSSVEKNGSVSCTQCVAGKYAPTPGYHECSRCPTGTYSNIEGASQCILCPEDTFLAGTGSKKITDCINCPSGSKAERGSSSCSPCPSGKYKSGSNMCTNCPRGKYRTTTGAPDILSCIDCPIGKYSTILGSTTITNCITCRTGTVSNQIGASSNSTCTLCDIGKYRDVGMNPGGACANCDPGKISNMGSGTCISCSAGYYKSSADTCSPCPIGTYRPTINGNGIASCTSCPSGRISNIGSTSCTPCPSGYYKVNGNNCNHCPAGTYRDTIGGDTISSCNTCPVGTYSSIIGSTNINNCIDCPIGTISNQIGATNNLSCIPCIAGEYRSASMNPGGSCSMCPDGSISARGSFECSICSRGKYSGGLTAMDHTICNNCPSGRFSSSLGATSIDACTSCGSGKYSSVSGATSENTCIYCPPGTYSETIAAINSQTCISCPAGKYRLTPGGGALTECINCGVGSYSIIGSNNCTNCPSGTYANIVGLGNCITCEIGKYASNTGSIQCEDCPENSEQERINKATCECMENTYRDGFLQNGQPKCISCPSNSVCTKGTTKETIKLNPGYWRYSATTLDIRECLEKQACKGGIITNSSVDTLCRKGHQGPYCEICNIGYAKNNNLCAPCPKEDMAKNIFISAMAPVGALVIFVILIRSANPKGNEKEEVSGVAKILMNYLQVFSLAKNFDIKWPNQLNNLFKDAERVSNPRISFYSSDCSIGWSYYDKFLVYLGMPIVYLLFGLLFMIIITLLYRKKYYNTLKTKFNLSGKPNEVVQQKYMDEYKKWKLEWPSPIFFFKGWIKTTIVVGLFLIYPSVIKNLITMLSCADVGNKQYLYKDMSIECYTNTHNTYRTFAYSFLVIYGLGIPLIAWKLLYNYRFRLFSNTRATGQDKDTSASLSFLFVGYRENRYYWEFVIMARKLGIIVISVFLKETSRYQMISACWLIQVSLILHIYFKPYDTITKYGKLCNRLEIVSLVSLVVTLNSGIAFGTKEANHNLGLFEFSILILVIFCNFVTFIYFMFQLLITGSKSGKEYFKKICKVILLNETHNKNTYEWKYMFKKLNNINICKKLLKWINDEEIIPTNLKKKREYFKNKQYTELLTNRSEKTEDLDEEIDKIRNTKLNKKDKNLIKKMESIHSKIEIKQKEQIFNTMKYNKYFDKLREYMEEYTDVNSMDNYFSELLKLFIADGKEHRELMNELLLEGLKSNNKKIVNACRKRILVQQFSDKVYEKIMNKIENNIPEDTTTEIVNEMVNEVLERLEDHEDINIHEVVNNNDIELDDNITNKIANGFKNVIDDSITTSIDSPSRVNLTERRRIKIDVPNNQEDENEK